MLDTGAHLSALAADSEAVAGLAEGRLDQPVPTCPGWTVADVIGHLGGAYSWAWAVVRAGGGKPDSGWETPPEPRDALIPWFRDQRRAVLDVLTSEEPDRPAWTFMRGGPQDVGWWRRRQALETAIHLCDVESATGAAGTIDPDLAADGVDELLAGFLPAIIRRRPVAALRGSLHVHCTDADGEWIMDLSAPELDVRREHAKADTAVRGPAEGLFRWVWNRATLDDAGLEVFGDRSVAEALSEIRI